MKDVVFKLVYPRGCGMDVHQKTVVATINGEGLTPETRTFGTDTRSLTEMRDWLLENDVQHVAMESTGIFWVPIHAVLEGVIPHVWVVNARHIKNVPGRKTDKKDSEWICQLLLAGLLNPSYIPSKEQRELRDLTRYRRILTRQIAAEKNRIGRELETANIKLESVVSDLHGVTATKLVAMIMTGRRLTMEDVMSVYTRRLSASPEELLEACNGFVDDHHVFMLRKMQGHIDYMEGEMADVSERISAMLAPYGNFLSLLTTIPGVGMRTAEDVVAEMGLDMSRFPSAHHLASWVGLAPGNYESAGKKKSSRTTKGNKHMRSALVESAWAASRCKESFYCERYHRLAARRGKKRALVAIAHSMLKAMYHLLSSGEEYRELGADYVPKRKLAGRKAYHVGELRKLGFRVDLSVVPAGTS